MECGGVGAHDGLPRWTMRDLRSGRTRRPSSAILQALREGLSRLGSLKPSE